MPVFVLSIHAAYGCRERGACCTAGWPIAVSDGELHVIGAAVRGRSIAPRTDHRPFFVHPRERTSEVAALLAVHDGACAFYTGTGSGRCAVHRALGHAALPLACRQFPRVSVHEPRGTAVTLSHYCPTAGDLLAVTAPLRITDDARAFPGDGEYVGLDARSALPPLLRPEMLMDWEAWWTFERLAIAAIDRSASADEAVARLAGAVEAARAWRPSDGPLEGHIVAAFRSRPCAPVLPADLAERVSAAIPEDLRPPMPAARPPVVDPDVHRRLLAAHAFANWTAHLGQGLRTWLASVVAAHALIARGLTVSETDLWLRHLVDPRALADHLSVVETL